MIRYVVGLAFTTSGNQVVLLEKDHPAWQKGYWNGPGGKVKVDGDGAPEDPKVAVSREFEEETGVLIPPDKWEMVVILRGNEYQCMFLRAFSDEVVKARTVETERVAVFPTNVGWRGLPLIPNLSWMIPLALDRSVNVPVVVWDRGGG